MCYPNLFSAYCHLITNVFKQVNNSAEKGVSINIYNVHFFLYWITCSLSCLPAFISSDLILILSIFLFFTRKSFRRSSLTFKTNTSKVGGNKQPNKNKNNNKISPCESYKTVSSSSVCVWVRCFLVLLEEVHSLLMEEQCIQFSFLMSSNIRVTAAKIMSEFCSRSWFFLKHSLQLQRI